MATHRLIREGRLRLGMSEQQFADAVGVSRGAVQQWEKEHGTAPKRATQPRVARLLGLSVAQLMGGAQSEPGHDPPGDVPLLTDAEVARYASVDHSKPGHRTRVPVNVDVRAQTFAWRVKGDSMIGDTVNSFPEGSVLIVEPDMEATTGDFVLVKSADGEIIFKQLVKDAGEYYLKPLNPRYPLKPLGGHDIIGVVREFSKRFR